MKKGRTEVRSFFILPLPLFIIGQTGFPEQCTDSGRRQLIDSFEKMSIN